MRDARVPLGLFVLLVVADLVIEAIAAVTGFRVPRSDVVQWLLMPALAWLLWTRATRPLSRLTRLALLALFFSWLGDMLPDFADPDQRFLVMVGAFWLAQLSYIAAFRPYRQDSMAHRRFGWIPYAVVLVGIVALCAPRSGALFLPLVVYGVTLTVMAAMATGLNGLAGIGGLLFLFSDALIALGEFTDIHVAKSNVLIMATYLLAQFLLIAGVLRHDRGRDRIG